MINTVRSKTFPFSMNELINEIKDQEASNYSSNEISDMLDGEGAQENDDVLEEGDEEVPRPTIDFSEWHDDMNITEYNSKSDAKFRPIELLPKDDLLARTRALVPEQVVVLLKVHDFVHDT